MTIATLSEHACVGGVQGFYRHDTSPRNTGIQGADESWDFGTAAGFYLDATETPWSRHWRMGIAHHAKYLTAA